MDFDELRRQFYERLKEQKERHDGGSHWVGWAGRPRSETRVEPVGGFALGPEGSGPRWRSRESVAGRTIVRMVDLMCVTFRSL